MRKSLRIRHVANITVAARVDSYACGAICYPLKTQSVLVAPPLSSLWLSADHGVALRRFNLAAAGCVPVADLGGTVLVLDDGGFENETPPEVHAR